MMPTGQANSTYQTIEPAYDLAKEYETSAKTDPNDFEMHMRFGQDFLDAGREYARLALLAFSNAFKIKNNAVAKRKQGNAFLMLGDYDQAIIAFNTSINFSGSNLETKGDLVYALLLKGDYREANIHASELVNLAPQSAVSYFLFGLTQIFTGSYNAAEHSLLSSISLEPKLNEVRYAHVVVLMILGKMTVLKEYLEQLTAQDEGLAMIVRNQIEKEGISPRQILETLMQH